MAQWLCLPIYHEFKKYDFPDFLTPLFLNLGKEIFCIFTAINQSKNPEK